MAFIVMSINLLGGCGAGMPQDILNLTKLSTSVKQGRRQIMPEIVGMDLNPQPFSIPTNHLPERDQADPIPFAIRPRFYLIPTSVVLEEEGLVVVFTP